ncbi:MAG TPA: hypothetical protein VKR31_05535 [Rhizomicrobium sp.]|nr:hypothetical protein [Rhizomicrobium sp.]
MGLLDYFTNLFPKPSDADIAKARSEFEQLQSAQPNSLLGGLLNQPSDAQLAQWRAQRGLTPAEPPSPMVSIGRGLTDLWEPVKQAYLNATDPAQAAAYRQQRAADEGFYQSGLQWANPQPDYVPSRDDLWRSQVHQLPLLLGALLGGGASMALPEATMSYGGTQNLLDALNTLRQQSGIGE